MVNIKLKELVIPSDDPFQNDKLSRKSEVEVLTSLIRNSNSPIVLAIDAEWGSGKTTFISMWKHYLNREDIKIQSFYFNAWATDFSEDPLVPFLGELNESLGKALWSAGEKKKIWDKTLKIGKQIAKRTIPVGVKIATAGLIDTDKLIEDETSKLMESLSNDAIETYLKQKNAIASFKDLLRQLILTSSKEKPIVIFIDELDRCRPTYAITLLERIKHLFDIEGLVFVLSLAKEQLSYSIGAVYGSKFNANSYLKRFIDFEYNLKEPAIDVYIASLFESLALDDRLKPRGRFEELRYDAETLKNVFILLAKYHDLKLREIEQLLSKINLAILTAAENEYIHPALLAFLVVTKSQHPDKYKQYISDLNSESEMIEHLYSIIPKINNNPSFLLIEGLLIAAKIGNSEPNKNITIKKYIEVINNSNETKGLRHYAQNIVTYVDSLVIYGRKVDLSDLVSRVEMLKEFKFELK